MAEGFMNTLNSPGGLAAIGSIGTALNAMENSRALQDMYGRQTQQLKDQIAFQRKIMEEQIALKAQERIRQQMMAQAAGDAFSNSLGQYDNFEGSMQSTGNNIADTFMQILSREAPDVAPAASGPVADRIANAVAQANQRSAADAGNLSKVQALARTLTDKSMAVGRNDQLAAMLGNFARGSQQASQGEIEARAGKLFQPEVMKPQPSMLGDLFYGLATGGVLAANRMNEPQLPNPYALNVAGAPQVGLRMPTDGYGSVGLTNRPASLGITSPRIVGD